MAAGARQVRAGVQPFEDLADGHPFVGEPAVEGAHQFGLVIVDGEVAGRGVVARHIAIAVWGTAAEIMAIPRPLQLATAEALAEHGALVLGDGALDLQQQLVVRVVRDRMVQERHLAANATELLEQDDLVGIAAGQPVGAEHRDALDGSVAHRVAQGIEAGPIEPTAAVSLVTEDVLLGERMAAGYGPGAQGGELAFNRLLALLALG
jgi:hypothetical protein